MYLENSSFPLCLQLKRVVKPIQTYWQLEKYCTTYLFQQPHLLGFQEIFKIPTFQALSIYLGIKGRQFHGVRYTFCTF